MNSRLPTYALVALFALLGATVVFVVASGGERRPEIASVTTDRHIPAVGLLDENVSAPDVAATTLGGETFNLTDQKGRIVVVNFWATWCAPCRVEIPDLIALQEEFDAEQVRFVGVSLDQEGEDVVRTFVEDAGITYPIMVDDGSFSDGFGGVYALPTTFVIDRAGVVKARKTGLVTKEELAPVLRDLAEPG